MEILNVPIKPFLRWAGGKRWLLSHICTLLKDVRINQYHEPFLGGGSLYFYLQPDKAFLSDLNEDLILTYSQVQKNVEDVLRFLSNFKNTEECYYKVRGSHFLSPSKRAARFIFLNQTSFNGIYRVNLKGEYNVPYGYREKEFYQPKLLRLTAKALKNANIQQGDFEIVIENLKSGDFVFLDPPYTVSHNNNGFIKYNQKLFSIKDQERLALLIEEIKARGAYYVLTNAAHVAIDRIFGDKADRKIVVERASLIGGRNATRQPVQEFLFTNILL